MAWPNDRRPNTARPNLSPSAGVAEQRDDDIRIVVAAVMQDDDDIQLLVTVDQQYDDDIKLKVVIPTVEDIDIKLEVTVDLETDDDVFLWVFNPLLLEDEHDIVVTVFNPIDMEDEHEILLDLVELFTEDDDIYLDIVENFISDDDVLLVVPKDIEDFLDLLISIHTDPEDPDVLKIARMIERRFIPYGDRETMFALGEDTVRFKLGLAIATAEFHARRNLERTLEGLRLDHAYGRALDFVGARVGETRWQFYDDRVDRFEGDECFRGRLRPYFTSKRATIGALQDAVDALHECYGGATAFFTYSIADNGWTLGYPGRTELGHTTNLGGTLVNLNPLQYLKDNDLWILGSCLRPLAGTVNYQEGSRVVIGTNTRFREVIGAGEYFYAQPLLSPVRFLGIVEEVQSQTRLLLRSPVPGPGVGHLNAAPFAKFADGYTEPLSPTHSDLGHTTWLGDRERFTPFSFLAVVTNYPTTETWRQLYRHTIERFKMAGTVPIIIFRSANMLQQVVIAADGTDTYTISSENLQGQNVIVFIDGVAQEPGGYALTNAGSDTTLEFTENVPSGLNIYINWVEDPV